MRFLSLRIKLPIIIQKHFPQIEVGWPISSTRKGRKEERRRTQNVVVEQHSYKLFNSLNHETAKDLKVSILALIKKANFRFKG